MEQTATESKVYHGCLEGWRRKLSIARQNGGFSKEDSAAAGNWDMCAVGEAHSLMDIETAYDTTKAPLDYELKKLGIKFNNVVKDACRTYSNSVDRNQFKEVEKTLDAIEKRLVELDKIGNRKNGTTNS